jgi:DNA-binding NtrC family response regulator
MHGMRFQLSEYFPAAPGAQGGGDQHLSLFQMLEEVERQFVLEMLDRTGWNQTEAAERFQIPLSTLNQKIKRLGIEVRRRGMGRAAGADSGAGK